MRRNPSFLGFGFLLTFCSSPGQTYFIGIFGPGIRDSFGLSHTEWGTVYLLGTLCSALLLPITGQLIDRIDLRRYTLAVMLGLCAACVTASLTGGLVSLVAVIFLLRQFGQGLTSHTAVTSVARYMDRNRGKALALASMGYSVAEATLPALAVVAIGVWGWRQTYSYTALIVVSLIPLALWLLRGHDRRHQHYLSQQRERAGSSDEVQAITRGQMLKERRFYLILPAILTPAYIGTAMFFHHLTLAEVKQWSALWVTGNYGVYAGITVMTSLLSGPLIDRYSAVRVVPYYLVPLMVGLLLLVPAENPLWVIPYMVFLGVNTGLYFTGISALWPELYGSVNLGAIKSIANALMVFASALGPVSIGILLDASYSFEMICILFVVLCIASTGLLILGLKPASKPAPS